MNGTQKNGVDYAKSIPVNKELEYKAITWSPKRHKVYSIDYQIGEDVYEQFRHWPKCMNDYILYPEVNLNGNVHWHGLISVRDKIKWWKSVLPRLKLYGFVVIKDLFKPEEWYKYITKDCTLMLKMGLFIELPFTRSETLKLYPNKIKLSEARTRLNNHLREHQTESKQKNIYHYIDKYNEPSDQDVEEIV